MNEENIVARMVEPLYRAKGWMTFAGVMSIIQGVFSILSIWGIIICWIPIWMGIVLCSAATHVRLAYESRNEDEVHLSMEKLGTYFRVYGILAVVMLVVAVIGIFAAIMIPAFAAARHGAFGQ